MPENFQFANASQVLDVMFSELIARGELHGDAKASAAFLTGMTIGIASVISYEDDGEGYDIGVDLMFLAMAASIACNIPPCAAYGSLANILQEVKKGYKARDFANQFVELIKGIKEQSEESSLD